MALDTDRLLTQVKLLGAIPTGRYEDSEILEISHDIVMSQIAPMITSLREEYYVTSESQTITANTAAYPIPYKALGLSLREAKRINVGNVEDLVRISVEDVRTTSTGTPTSFYLQGQDIILYPTPASTDGSTLKLYYYSTPSKPVGSAEVAIITDIDTSTGVITAAALTTWTIRSRFDLASRRNGHRTLSADLVPTAVTPNTSVQFTPADISSSVAVGDYVCLAGESIFYQVPDICFPLIVQKTVSTLLESMGDAEGLRSSEGKAQMLQQMVVTAMANRITGAPQRTKISII